MDEGGEEQEKTGFLMNGKGDLEDAQPRTYLEKDQ